MSSVNLLELKAILAGICSSEPTDEQVNEVAATIEQISNVILDLIKSEDD